MLDGEARDTFLAVAIACALGFTVRLKQSIKAHARSALMDELASRYPTTDSLRALEPSDSAVAMRFCSRVPVGVLCADEYRMTIQAYWAALQISELAHPLDDCM